MGEISMREQQTVAECIQIRYGSGIEYPWMRSPTFGIFHHRDNKKWSALIMDIPRRPALEFLI